jgi:prepilin-type N-terminal cleavage/methylation domain-containing protein
MMIVSKLRKRLRGQIDGGFTLIEMVVSLGILSIVSSLAFSILVSTRNISSVVTWQSTTNTELRLLIDGVFADIETARPPLGCDTDSDGKADTATVSVTLCGTESKMVESEGPVLLVASPNRVCYYTNRIQSRQAGTTNPPYTPACLAVVGTSLQLETFPAPLTVAEDWNRALSDPTRPPDQVRILATVDENVATDGYFEFYNATTKDLVTNKEKKLTGTQTATIAGVTTVTDALAPLELQTVNSVVMRARMRLGGNASNKNQSRDIVYRISLRAARYSAERCGFGNVVDGSACSS